MRKFRILIILALAVAGLLVVCLTIGIVLSFSAGQKETNAFDDSDLIPVRIEVPIGSNAFWTLLKATNALYWPDSLEKKLVQLSDNSHWDDVLASNVLEKNQHCLDFFDEAMRRPFLLVSEPNRFAEEYSYLSGWRTIGRVESIHCVALFRANDEKEAFASALKLVRFGQRVENSGGPLLHYLVGSAIKSSGLERIQQMIPRTKLQETNLIGLIHKLNDFRANLAGLTNAIKVEYQMECKFVDDFAAGRVSMTNSDLGALFASTGMKFVFDARKTKMKFAQADRVLRNDISKPFSTMSWSDLPVVKTNASTWWYLIHGNAIGDIYFEMLEPSLKSIAARKCRENVNVTATQLLLALKVYKMQHGSLPESLSQLVPQFFRHVPIDDFDGKPFHYLPGKKLIYSVGPDLKDSGGKPFQENSSNYDLPFKIEF